jgi:hypothetical protein
LSLLGTWCGTKGEEWNEHTSSLSQLLLSIQSQILVEEPYFNEPGYIVEYGLPNGKAKSKYYNIEKRLYTLKHTVCDLIQFPTKYSQFTEVIHKHFLNKKDYLIELCNKWKKDDIPNVQKYNEFIQIINTINNNK